MRLGILIVSSLVLAAARPGFPACGDQAADAQAVADTRAAAASECDCAAAASHASYVYCVVRVANTAARRGTLRPQCRTAVVRCAARSTCGRPGDVTCCRTRADRGKRCSGRCGGHRDRGVPPCSGGETPGAACSPEGARCDPQDDCDRLLVCATTDPVQRGGCPISRRDAKDHIRYLDDGDLKRLHDEVMRLRLATFRYRQNASRTQLGFIIDDAEPSPSIDPARDMVDLYAYTSMAVAALQTQAHE